MKDVRGAGFAGSSPPFLGRERAAVGVDVGPERRSPRYQMMSSSSCCLYRVVYYPVYRRETKARRGDGEYGRYVDQRETVGRRERETLVCIRDRRVGFREKGSRLHRQKDRERQSKTEENVDGRPVGARRAGVRWRGSSTFVCVLLKRKKQKARPKGVNLKVRWRAKVAMRYCSEESARRAILVWECRDRPPRRSVGKGACACSCGYDPTPGQGNP